MWSKIWAFVRANPILAGAAGAAAVVVVVGGTWFAVSDDGGSSRSAAPETVTSPTTPPTTNAGDLTLDGLSATCSKSGRVEVAGPNGLKLTGACTATDARNWSVTVDGGSGSFGGFQLASSDFSGTISSANGAITSNVAVAITRQPKIVPEWSQSSVLALTWSSAAKALAANFSIDASRGTGRLSGSAPVASDGTYELPMSGQVVFGGTPIALSGSTSGSGRDGARGVRWSINGSAGGATVDGARVNATRISMTHAAPGVTGSTQIDAGQVMQIPVDGSLRFVDEGNWLFDASGSSVDTWSPDALPTLVVHTADMDGTIEANGGTVEWKLVSPMEFASDGLSMDGSLTFGGVGRFLIDVSGGRGTVLGLAEPLDAPVVAGQIAFDHGAVIGTVSVTAGGELFLDLPDGWDSTTRLAIHFLNGPSGFSTSTEVSAAISRGNSLIVLNGATQGTDAFALTVGGALRMGQTPIPVLGRYESAGYVHNGVARTEPYWNFSGDIGSVAGGVPLAAGGFGLKGGSIGMASALSPASVPYGAGVRSKTYVPTELDRLVAMSSTSLEGAVDLAMENITAFMKTGDIQYTDENNWMVTATADGGPAWHVPGFNNLIIDADTITGTVTNDDGELSFDLTIGELVWTNMTTGVVLTTDFSIGNSCPLEDNCPEAEGIFVGWTNGEMDLPDDLPTLAVEGAFLTDGSWARMTGVAPDATGLTVAGFASFDITEPTLTIWKGERSDSFDANMEMPDLSSSNNGLNFEFCGGLEISIPDLGSHGTSGCAEWTPDGFVIAQVAVNADIDTDLSTGGLQLDSSALTGWAYTSLSTMPSVDLYGTALKLLPDLNQITAQMVLPGILMDKVGLDDSLSNIGATGWFDGTDFSLDGALDVDMTNGGFSLNTITVHIGKDGHDFTLGFGAESTVSVNGNKFPMNAYVGLAIGSTTEVSISMDMTGTQSAQPNGSFDMPALIPTGDFEPSNASEIDGSFDNRTSKGLLSHGDFENASEQQNMLTNSDFESGTGATLVTNPGFEDGSTSDVLSNGDFESFDISGNGDFEDGNYGSWSVTSNYQMTQVSDTAPTEDEGVYAYNLKNNFSSSTATQTGYVGLYQNLTWTTVQNAQYTFSVWAKSNDSSNGRIKLWIQQSGTASGCSSQSAIQSASDIFTVTPTWQQFSFTITANNSCRSTLSTLVSVIDSQDTVELDAMTFEPKLTNSVTWLSGLPNVDEPNDQLSGIPSSNVIVRREPSLAHSGDGYLAATGTSSNWDFYWSTLESPAQYTTWTFTAWVRCRTCTSATGNLYVFSQGGTEDNAKSPAPVTITQTWQRLTLSMYMRYSGHTDLRVGFMDISAANTEFMFDDWSLQQVGWTGSPAPTGNGTPQGTVSLATITDGSISRTDDGALEFISRPTSAASGQSAYIDTPAPTQGATYTASVWVKSPTAASSAVRLDAIAIGGTQETFTGTTTNITTGWTQLTKTFTVANGSHTALRIAVYNLQSASAASPKTIYIDDVSLTGTPLAIPQDSSSMWSGVGSTNMDTLPPITRSSSSSVYLASDLGNTGNSLRTDGNGDWWYFNTDSYGYVNGDFDMSVDVLFANSSSRDIADIGFWITSPGSNSTGYAYRLDTSSSYNSGFIASSGGNLSWVSGESGWRTPARNVWYRVRLQAVGDSVTATVTRLDNNTVVRTNTVTLSGGNRAGVFGQVRDGAGSNEGSRWDNFQINSGSSTTTVYDDASKAHGGAGYMQIRAGSSGASASRTTASAPVQGSTYTASAWVRSSGGTNVSGKLTAKGAGTSDSVNTTFTATSTWQQVSVNLPINASGATGVTMQLDNNTSGQGLLIDDVAVELQGLTQPTPWGIVPGSGGSVNNAIWNDSSKAHAGNNYMVFTAKTSAGSVVNTSTFTPVAGDLYTAAVWVRSDSGSNLSGQIGLSAEGGTVEQRWSNFTANGTWQQVFVSLPITQTNNTSLNVYMKATTLNSALRIDDAELNKVSTWVLTQPSGTTSNVLVINDRSMASDGTGYARITTSGANAGINASGNETITAGSTWKMQARVRSTNGSNLSGQMKLWFQGGASGEVGVAPFTATGDWQDVYITYMATKSNTRIAPEIVLNGSGSLDVDSITVVQDIIVQSDPWTTTGAASTFVVKNDPSRAHQGDGELQLTLTGTGEGGITHAITERPAVGTVYTGTAWVRSSTGTPANGRFVVTTQGGTTESAQASFTATSTWQQVSFNFTIANSNHTGMTAQVLLSTPNVTVDVDDVNLQKFAWSTFGGATQTQVNDAGLAQSGSGYGRVSKSANGDAGIQLDTPGNLTQTTDQTMIAYVRSTNGSRVNGHITLSGLGGSAQDSASTSFVATDKWQKITVTVHVSNTGQTGLRSKIFVDSANLSLDVDSVLVAQAPIGAPDGVSSPLPHPESGYVYIWDDAFGIPGAHLWAMSAEVAIINGRPALGIGATMYFDPTKASGVMTGTDWIKGDLVANISTVEPCFQFGFNATGLNSAVQINGGVLRTTQFMLSFAPRGCTVGQYTVAPGSMFSFDATLGDASLHFDLEIGRDDDDLPTFYTDMRVENLKLAGVTYNSMELIIDISQAGSTTSFNGDFTLPMGRMTGSFLLTVNNSMLHQEGDVTLSDWKMVGGSFDIYTFNYHQVIDIPFGSGSCAAFSASTSGRMTMGKKNYDFSGNMTIDCGRLTVLHIQYQYWKKAISYQFNLDYNSNTHVLSGGMKFKFERSTSWKFLSHRYRRHPKFVVYMNFSMDFDNPGNGHLDFYGSISVSGGSGSLGCSLNANGDDSCSLYVRINIFGGHTYRSSW